MDGHLHLTAERNPCTGRTALRAQSFRAPMHIGKGHWDEHTGVLTVHTVNATAGLFAGDTLDWRIQVAEDARLRLVSPSATRVFRHARPGRVPGAAEARTGQTFDVGPGAWLEVWPEGFIPHAGSRHRQTTRLSIDEGGAALWCEILAPGRVASGEAWEFERLRWALDISYAGCPVVRERWDLQPAAHPVSIAGWQLEQAGLFAKPPFYASLVLINAARDGSEIALDEWHDAIEDPRAGYWLGASRLEGNVGWSVRMLAADGAILRRTLRAVRAAFLLGCPSGHRGT